MLLFGAPMRPHRYWIFAAALGLAGLAGCGQDGPRGLSSEDGSSPVGEVSSPVKDGTVDTETTGVLALKLELPGDDHLCTASLILPNLVLTARHCIAEYGNFSCDGSSFGPAFEPQAITLTADVDVFGAFDIEVDEVWHPTTSEKCGGDVALLRLSAPVEGSVAAPLVPRVDGAAVSGEAFAAVGYGYTNAAGDGIGIRHRADGFTVACSGLECSSPFVVGGEWSSVGGFCQGDSGGPALDVAGRAIGVVSRGFGTCGKQILGDVAAHGDWIRERAAAAALLGGFDPPPWVNGWPTDPAFSAEVGASCESDDECTPGRCADGACTRRCSDDAPCPDGMTCEPLDDGLEYCHADDDAGAGGGMATGTGDPDESGDGGCDISRRSPEGGPGAAWLVMAVALGVARRARRAQRAQPSEEESRSGRAR